MRELRFAEQDVCIRGLNLLWEGGARAQEGRPMVGDKAVVWGPHSALLLPSLLPPFPVDLKEGVPGLRGEVGKGVPRGGSGTGFGARQT